MTIEERRKILLNDGKMPTAIFSADKKDFIVKPRTIFCKKQKRQTKNIFRTFFHRFF
jgi:hypothetical protein